MVLALGIETATSVASVAVVDDRGVRAERALPMQGSHARTLLPLIDDVLAAAAVRLAMVDILAVSIGPGSFTGLRIGLSVAKGLALAADVPLVGICTLEAYARTATPRPGLICPVLDARKGEVYAAAYRWDGAVLQSVLEPAAIDPRHFAAQVASRSCLLLGDGVDAYPAIWRAALGPEAELIALAAHPPRAAIVAGMGIVRGTAGGSDDVATLEPTYCRLAEAEQTRGERKQQRHVVVQAGVEKLTGGRA